jgi:Ca-activated chloride channel family protein
MKKSTYAFTAITMICSMMLSGCSGMTNSDDPDKTLNIVAGSEISDMKPILQSAESDLGIKINITYSGTLDGTDGVMANSGADYDATWFPSNAYMSLFSKKSNVVSQESPIMSSPIVLGIKPSSAARLGWDKKAPSWSDIVSAASSGNFTYGMTSPVSSNSGFSTLVELATALSGTGTALNAGDITKVSPQLKEFANGQKVNSGSSGWLMDAFNKNPDKVDGVFNYASMISSSKTKLTTIVPSDGVITADYKLSLLAGKSSSVNDNYKKLVAYLKKTSVQKRIHEVTKRDTSTSPSTSGSFEIQFPSTMSTIQTLLKTYVAQVRKPANMVFQIDTSGSMQGSRLDDLKSALGVLSGSTSKTDNDSLMAIQPREHIRFIDFSDTVKSRKDITVSDDETSADAAMKTMNTYFDGLDADGGTAIYSTLQESLADANRYKTNDNVTSVVLFTDGQNTSGISYREFLSWYAANKQFHGIPVYSIVFGEGDANELKTVSEETGGKTFDASSQSLSSVFKEIRGYL